ncbi:uncharacterized protein I303_108582 [Kwoniella dejecticola CBS 10117]|uniref:Uncharacterized protein n=1 Tax=Kwoniella dejecticola CBS 10117 TaxID=1296121 RepID=A0AAJ8KYX4_9TREE
MPQNVVQRPASLPRRQTTGQHHPMFLGSGQSSLFLSPVQEARIDSWRKGASEATPPAATANGKTKNKNKTSEKHNTRPEPPLPVSPKSPINFAVLKAPDKLDLPTDSQVRPHQIGVLPPVQWPPAVGQEIPMREMAKPAKEPPLPRIAGVRDPISTNYYRQMFPPQGGAMPMMIPGIHPIGTVPAKPWNT